MARTWLRSVVGGLLLSLVAAPGFAEDGVSAHDFDFTSIEGDPLPMARYSGQAVLLVNTASFCGFTPQYEALQALWETYREQGLVVLGVPSNDFGGQEPGDEAAIKDFCEANYLVDFPMTTKQTVIGARAHPLYQWIVDTRGSSSAPRWNFHKYLIGKDGRIISGWSSRVTPLSDQIVAAVDEELAR
jgi:glutathione peroxidase